jgi:hypothetical protein
MKRYKVAFDIEAEKKKVEEAIDSSIKEKTTFENVYPAFCKFFLDQFGGSLNFTQEEIISKGKKLLVLSIDVPRTSNLKRCSHSSDRAILNPIETDKVVIPKEEVEI